MSECRGDLQVLGEMCKPKYYIKLDSNAKILRSVTALWTKLEL